jgi:hypothetical protein
MIVLDCESREATLASVATVYGVSGGVIDELLWSFDVDAHYSKKDVDRSPDEELRALFEQAMNCVATPIDRVCWFHLTRPMLGLIFQMEFGRSHRCSPRVGHHPKGVSRHEA